MNERNINKGEVHVNLHTKPLVKTKKKKDEKNRISYNRYNKNKTVVAVNPNNHNVPTMWKFYWEDFEKDFGKKRGNKSWKNIQK